VSVNGYEVRVDIQVRFRDVDALGHVNNAVFGTYFEMARVEYFKTLMGSVDARWFPFVIARLEMDYVAPVTLADALSCDIRVAAATRSTFTFEYLIRKRGSQEVVAQGRTVQVCYSHETKRSAPLDDALWERMVALRTGRGLAAPERTGKRTGSTDQEKEGSA
jgi:acyl-CoA thioester hydrolase